MDDAELARSKAAFHRRQADLPFEDKIRAVVRMQQAARELAQAGGRPGPRHVWDISDLEPRPQQAGGPVPGLRRDETGAPFQRRRFTARTSRIPAASPPRSAGFPRPPGSPRRSGRDRACSG